MNFLQIFAGHHQVPVELIFENFKLMHVNVDIANVLDPQVAFSELNKSLIHSIIPY